MYKYHEPFGHHVSGKSIGETWISLVDSVLAHGDLTFDEKRERRSIQNVVYQIDSFSLPDPILSRHANAKNIEALKHLTFVGDRMFDFDVRPSFSPGARSYHARITQSRMLEYVIKRLTAIPESKKAVMSFIHWDDYKAVLDTPFDDYLPCHTTIQFRLVPDNENWKLNVISHFRSIDAFQKSCGDFVVTAMLAEKVRDGLAPKLGKVTFGTMMGVITDAHVYKECYQEAAGVLKSHADEIKH